MLSSPNAGAAGTAARNELSPEVQRAIATAVAKELTKYGGKQPVPGAAVGVWVPGKGEFVKGIGYGRVSPLEGMWHDDLFRVGSNTKTFVTTVLLQLVDEKKIRLDDTIASFDLGLAVPNEKSITLRELAEMRSGIIDLYAIPAVQKESMRSGRDGRRVNGSRSPRSSRRYSRREPSTTTATPTGSCSGSSSRK